MNIDGINKDTHTGLKALSLAAILTSSVLTSFAFADGEQLYRYQNEKGVQVIGYTIPPEFAQKGYEIIDVKGRVLKVIPPAPSPEEVARQEALRKLLDEYKKLKRRYSAVRDIEAARDRRLASIETNIKILEANISGLDEQLDDQLARAAHEERVRGKASKRIVNQIAATRTELDVAHGLLKIRHEEYEEARKKFQQDIALYVKGATLMKQQEAKNSEDKDSFKVN